MLRLVLGGEEAKGDLGFCEFRDRIARISVSWFAGSECSSPNYCVTAGLRCCFQEGPVSAVNKTAPFIFLSFVRWR